jgi:PAS domain-containing protein
MGHQRPLTAVCANGAEFSIEATIARVAIEGQPYYAAIVCDISAQQQAEAERIAIEARAAAAQAVSTASETVQERLLEILESFPGGMLLMTAPDADIEFVNRTMREMLGNAVASHALPVYGRDFRFMRSDGEPLSLHERPGRRVLRRERVQNVHLILQENDGRCLPVVVAARLRNIYQGKVTVIMFV